MATVDKLFDLPIYRTHAWIFNCYAVVDHGQATLIDVGLPSIGDAVIDGLAAHDIDPSQLRALLCTHAHSDHVGGMPRVLERATTDTYFPARCEGYLAGERPRRFGANDAVRFLPVWAEERFSFRAVREFLQAGTKIGFGGPKDMRLPFTPTGFLADGAMPAGLPGWEVIAAPGHTDDSTCFYHRDSATLLAGDAVATLDGRAWFNPEWVDAGLSVETEERLRSLEVRHLLPGHGKPIEGSDIWTKARSFRDRPEGKGLLARCSRRLARWD